ncbi:protein FAM32A-like isoform X1 [Xenia sp. Carnegie-2017]|uniref:protein FAM32A-like isoform X1 n=1 Tax=Xenia sp. Carnegie-2017 TaxID=2897299 RepID=UPI001F04C596|nr:protein FAM32A-like isoform X1 [Xenia sp. Carnegie-2017]
MSDAYDVVGGSLKLKGVKDGGVKKKKKKSKKREHVKKVEAPQRNEEIEDEAQNISKSNDRRTPAQIAFDRVKEKRSADRILAKASQSHKERVAEFNERLDKLTEHYDIPKVSWTK